MRKSSFSFGVIVAILSSAATLLAAGTYIGRQDHRISAVEEQLAVVRQEFRETRGAMESLRVELAKTNEILAELRGRVHDQK